MVCLDRGGRADKGHGFDHIRIKGSLREKINGAEMFGFFLENFDEHMPDAPTLLFRIFYSLESGKKLFAGIDIAKALTKALGKQLANPFGLVLPQEPIVDENTDQSFFDRLVNQCRGDRRIYAATQGAEHSPVANLFADLLHRSLDEVLHSPGWLTTTDAKDKVIEYLLAAWGMRHLGMKLDAEQSPAGIDEGSDGRIAAVGKRLPSLGHRRHLIAMAHPDADQLILTKSVKQVGHPHAVTDTEKGNRYFKHLCFNLGSVCLIDARRPTGENNAFRF